MSYLILHVLLIRVSGDIFKKIERGERLLRRIKFDVRGISLQLQEIYIFIIIIQKAKLEIFQL